MWYWSLLYIKNYNRWRKWANPLARRFFFLQMKDYPAMIHLVFCACNFSSKKLKWRVVELLQKRLNQSSCLRICRNKLMRCTTTFHWSSCRTTFYKCNCNWRIFIIINKLNDRHNIWWWIEFLSSRCYSLYDGTKKIIFIESKLHYESFWIFEHVRFSFDVCTTFCQLS